ncbi:MAG: Ig-like domain-containing protein, partial [Methylophagaceae bacterium]
SSGAILTSHSWDGSTGGIICFRATGQVDNSGTISVDGLGYRSPEQKAPLWRNANGGQGEGIYGLGIASGANQSGNCQNNAAWNNANGNGGGGGTGCGDSGGGGGGSYGTVGTVGINGGHTPGQPGSVVGLADLSKLVFGGAGGEGGADEDGAYPGTGGNGGGIIFVSAPSIANPGTILSKGIDGNDGTNGSPGSGCGTRGGGGGAGGSIFISSSISGSGTIVAIGGDGGRSVGGCNNNNKYGGDGGNGRIGIASPGSNFPTTSPVANEASLPVISGYSYAWSDGSSNNTLLVSPSATTTYSVTATSGSSTLTKDLTITVLQNPSVPDINDVSHCAGTFTFSAPVDTGATLVWYSSANDTVPVYYGNSFTTGSLSADTNFYYSSIAGNAAPVGDFADAPVALAVGLRKLVGSYSGNAIKLRRSSDQVEQDFGFTSNGELDVNAIQAWLGSSTGYVKTVYDQSGNSRDFTHSTASRQPELLISGVNSMPTLNFTTSNQLRMTSNVLSWPLTIIGTAQLTNNNCGRVFGGSGGNWLHGFYSNIVNRFHYDTWILNSGTHNISATNSTPYIVSSINPAQNSHSFYSNGNFLQTVNGNGNAPNGFTLNGHNNGSQMSNVKILELIIYGAAITVDELNAVENNIAERYGVPYAGSTSSNSGLQSSGVYCGENPNRKSVTAIVDASLTEDATFNYSKASYCAGDNNPTANVTGTLGGVFTSTTGLAIDPATGAIDLATSTDATYTVTYTTSTNTCGAASTFDVVISSQTSPTVDAGADQTVCAGTNVTLTGSGATFYAWDNGVTDFTAFAANSTTTYTVTGTSGNTNCTATDQVVITVNPLPTVNAGTDQTVCAGTNVTLTGSGAT